MTSNVPDGAGNDEKRSGGGAATTGGTVFQEDVAVWLATQIVAESAAPTSFGLPEAVTIDSIIAESFNPVDDLRAATSAGGEIFIQSKSTLPVSEKVDSELASVVDQFVRQIGSGVRRGLGPGRPLKAELDRLVLVVGSGAPSTVTGDLADALHAVRPAAGTALAHEVDENRNEEQARALRILRAHFDRAWQAMDGLPPAPEDWGLFVQLTRIRALDVGEDGADRRESDILFRNHILVQPEDATAARNALIAIVRKFGPKRTGADRSYFREQLARARLSLKGLRSFEADIVAVRKYSTDRLPLLRRLSEINYRGATIKIERNVVAELVAMAGDGGLVVIGEPGVGKSGCLHDVAAQVMDGGTGCILLEAEQLHVDSPATLAHGLGISKERTLPDVLAAWPVEPAGENGLAPRYLVIDALDAARGSCSLSSICELIRQVHQRAPQWRVVVSIREFDLRHSGAVQDLFPGTPHHELRSVNFPNVRHIEVRRLTSPEMASAHRQCPPLAALLTPQSGGLVDLATNSFNLSLLIQLLEMQVAASEFAAVRVRTDLLDLYWRKRVEAHDPQGTLQAAARTVVEGMKAGRDLGVNREVIAACPGVNGGGLTALLRQGVLRSERRRVGLAVEERLSFAHNVLFDYAAARLWLRDLSASVIAELERPEGQDLVLFARSSLVLAFEALWYQPEVAGTVPCRELFWERALAIAGSKLRLVGKIIATGVAASEYRQLADIEYLLRQLVGARSRMAAELVRHVVTAAFTRFDSKRPETRPFGPSAPEWLALAAELAERADGALAWQARILLLPIERDESASPSAQQWVWANRAARGLLGVELQEGGQRRGIITALAIACRSIEAHPEMTVRAIRSVLDPKHAEHWHDLLRPLADQIGDIASVSPALAARVIHAAFTVEFSRDEQIPAQSRILPLTFNKRDSIELVRRALAKSIVAMLGDGSPLSVLLAVLLIEASVKASHGRSLQNRDGGRFTLRGKTVRVLRDFSSIWSGQAYAQHEAWSSVLAALRERLEAAAHQSSPPTTNGLTPHPLDTILDVIVRRARTGIIWDAVLQAAALAPATLGVKVWELILSHDVLTDPDLRDSAAALISVLWPHLDRVQRSGIERAILALVDAVDHSQVELMGEERDALLGCIPAGEAVTGEAIARLAELATVGVPPHVVSRGGVTVESVTQDDWLRLRGVAVDAPANKEVRDLTAVLQNAKAAGGNEFSGAEVESLLPKLQELRAKLAGATAQGVSQEIAAFAESVLYSTMARLAKAPDISRLGAVHGAVRSLLIDASSDPRPTVPARNADSTDEGLVGWGSGQPRIEAADGLMHLASNQSGPDPDVMSAIRRLARDDHWAVRFQVRAHLNLLWDVDRASMWDLIEQCAVEESDARILRFFADMLVRALTTIDPDRVDRLLTSVDARVKDRTHEGSIGESLAQLLVWRVVRHDHEPSRARVAAWVAQPVVHEGLVHKVTSDCRGLMVFDNTTDSRKFAERVRGWAFETLVSLTNNVVHESAALLARHHGQNGGKWSKDDTGTMTALVHLADHISKQVYFASGAFNEHRSDKSGGDARSDSANAPEQVSRFFVEAGPLVDRLCDLPFVNAAHAVLETLQFLIPLGPARVFGWVHRCVMVASRDAIHYEAMAADLVVEIVERFLAEHRNLFRSDELLRTQLMDVLDLFVEAGWPQAHRLTFQLDEAFR